MRVVILFFLASTLLLNCKNEASNTANNADSTNAGTGAMPGLAVAVDSNFMHLDALGFQEIIQKKPNTAIFDLRSAEDFSKGHIDNAINRPYVDNIEFFTYFNELGASQPIALYDNNGYISNIVGAILAPTHDYVYVLKGGIYSWYEAQIPVVTF
ncbi:MAG: Thioredoxin [Bacteroidota bacterium]